MTPLVIVETQRKGQAADASVDIDLTCNEEPMIQTKEAYLLYIPLKVSRAKHTMAHAPPFVRKTEVCRERRAVFARIRLHISGAVPYVITYEVWDFLEDN